MNDELILHHYDGSPFSEKIRLILGYKKLAWRSVKIPAIMPKPDVTALTGGYRRTPILQVGADVYCDSARIAQLLEQRAPQPTLYPKSAPLAPALAQWADAQLFWTVIPYTMQPAGMASVFKGVPPEHVKAFGADRAPFTAGMKRSNAAEAAVNLRRYAGELDAQLGNGGPYLFGAEASIADFAVAHCIWYVHRGGSVAELLAPYAALDAWYVHLRDIGHGRSQPLASGDAVALAAAAADGGAYAPCGVAAGTGLAAGARVAVLPLDYGFDPTSGELVGLDDTEIVVRRRDQRAGTVHVHFPRAGYQVREETPS